MKRIFRATLRTLDVEAAEAFYLDVLGTKPIGVVRLHDHAIARGAKPHWLGFIDVGDDVERAAASFVEHGGTSMGPKWINPEGLEAAMTRDPGGALIALAKPPPAAPSASGPEVVFYTLDTPDVRRAMATYGALFGWAFGEPLDLGSLGTFHPFSWEAGAPQAGVFGDLRGRSNVHPQWMFHFRVAALEVAIARVEASGGSSLGPVELPSGDRLAVCEDPQGAAFALYELGTRREI
jgi:predicted enzyme related to lactoylglutathione lyase